MEVSPADIAEALCWSIVAVARADGVAGVPAVLGGLPEEEQALLVEAIGGGRTAFAHEALTGVAASPAPSEVRKAARRALHRLRSGR